MTHKSWREKAESYRMMFLFWDGGKKSFKEVAAEFGVSAAGLSQQIRMFQNYSTLPKAEFLDNAEHSEVVAISEVINLESRESVRFDLMCKFQFSLDRIVHPPKCNQAVLRKVMEFSGLRWFELNGLCYVHFEETGARPPKLKSLMPRLTKRSSGLRGWRKSVLPWKAESRRPRRCCESLVLN